MADVISLVQSLLLVLYHFLNVSPGEERLRDYFDYQTLMLKRSSRSKFMPNAYVFPGGVLAESDCSAAWVELFQSLGYNEDDLEALVLKDVDRPFLMSKAEVTEGVARDLALRLTAIRETFEESGVLLYRGAGQSGAFSDPAHTQWLAVMREKVQREPGALLSVYQHLGVVPDLWALKEWADWLTPTDLKEKGNRRFDTIFYWAQLESLPASREDQQEVTALQWGEPALFLHQFYQSHLWLAPPQVYELGKLLTFPRQTSVGEYCQGREAAGLSTWLPVRAECSDGVVSLLPGDLLYPASPVYQTDSSRDTNIVMKLQGSLASSRGDGRQLNRLEFKKDFSDTQPVVSIKLPNKLVTPLTFKQFQVRMLLQ